MREDHVAGYGKWLTTNEIRAEYNLEPIDGGDEVAVEQGFGGSQIPAGPNNQEEDEKKRLQKLGIKILRQRPIFRKKLELIASSGAMIEKALTEALIAKATKKKTSSKTKTEIKVKEAKKPEDYETKDFRSLFPEQTMKATYYNYINKKIDDRSKPFEKAMETAALEQEERVIEALEKFDADLKGVYSKMSHSDVSSLMDKEKEVGMLAKIGLPFLLDYARAGGDDAADLTDESFDLTDELQEAMTKRSVFFATSVTDTTFAKLTASLTAGINEGEGIGSLTGRVQEVYKEIPRSRAALIARTETTNANNEGMLAQYKQSEVVQGKEWIATMDDRTRDSHYEQNGDIVLLEAPFANGLQYPSEPNCRCVIAPALFD
jgi:SPP1 gp7 family putative phage head morphogenesis protein